MQNELYLFIALLFSVSCISEKKSEHYFPANNNLIRYTGRGEFSNSDKPRFWQPGVYMEAKFEGTVCKIIVHDQQRWGNTQNYLQIVLDDQEFRIKTSGTTDTLELKVDNKGPHDLLVCKNTEAGAGWLEFGGLICEKLLPLEPAPKRKIEFIGNSITCGAGADASEVPCNTGRYEDQHNAYHSYGPLTARALNAQWHLSSVSGIGLIHSCCDMDIVMPPVYDNIDMQSDALDWDFTKYQPDVVTVCLGQNDGVQDSVTFCDAYLSFIDSLREHYPKAEIILLNSPMGDPVLTRVLKSYLTEIVETMHRKGDQKVDTFFFSKSFNSGCGYHPDLAEHKQISRELTAYLKKKMEW